MKKINTIFLLLFTVISLGACEAQVKSSKKKKPVELAATPHGSLDGVWSGRAFMLVEGQVENCLLEFQMQPEALQFLFRFGATRIACQSVIVEYAQTVFEEVESSAFYNEELLETYQLNQGFEGHGWVSRDYRVLKLDHHDQAGSTRFVMEAFLDDDDYFVVQNLQDIYNSEIYMELVEPVRIGFDGTN